MPFDNMQPAGITIGIKVVVVDADGRVRNSPPPSMEETIVQYWRDIARNVGIDEPLRELTCKEKTLLHRLVALLRTPENWPQGFVWSYSSAPTCAMGLAMHCFGCSMGTFYGTVAWPVFGSLHSSLGITSRDVTPAHVAYALEYLIGEA